MIKLLSPYKHLVQKPCFCGPACIQMILFRRGIWVEQEKIGQKCGAKILPKDSKKFSRKILTTRNSKGTGIWLTEFAKPKIVKFLKKYKLKPKVFLVGELENPVELIEKNLRNNNDIIANFWWKPINDVDYGHFVLVSEFDEKTKTLTICDPWYASKSFWKIKLSKLLKGMTKEFDGRERGFVVVSGI